jgi:hypothetical protein
LERKVVASKEGKTMTKDQRAQLIKTAYGYDYRGVAITRTKSGEFTYGKISQFNYRPASMKLAEVLVEIDEHLAKGATVERYRIKAVA